METMNLSKKSKLYIKLLESSNKQYKNIKEIKKAYIMDSKVYGIDYISKNGIFCIASNTFDCDKIINFVD